MVRKRELSIDNKAHGPRASRADQVFIFEMFSDWDLWLVSGN